MSVKISDRDNGYRKVLTNVRSSQGAVRVGVTDAPHEGREDGLTVDQVGAFHEFGLGNNPQRSFLRAWVDSNQPGIKQSLRYWTTETLYGRIGWKDAMSRFGEYCVKGVRQRIMTNIPPPLTSETVARKGGNDVALVDTEQLINGIIYDVHQKVGGS